MDVVLTVDTRKAIRAFARAPGHTAKEVQDALDHIRRKFFKGWFAQASSRLHLTPRVGLANKIRGKVSEARGGGSLLERLRLIAYSVADAFWAHERGGVVHGRPWLRIPLAEARTSSGRVQKKYRVRNLSDVRGVFLRSWRGEVLIGKRKRGSIHPRWLFILKRSVTLRPRLGFFAFWRGLQPWAFGRLNTAVDRAHRKADL